MLGSLHTGYLLGGGISDEVASFSQEIPRKGHSSEPALANSPRSWEMSSLLLKEFMCHKPQCPPHCLFSPADKTKSLT